jgi:hypothetical protein
MEVMDMRIVRVTTTDFELEDGRIYQHPVPLEKAPSLKQFQAIYDRWERVFHEEEERIVHAGGIVNGSTKR